MIYLWRLRLRKWRDSGFHKFYPSVLWFLVRPIEGLHRSFVPEDSCWSGPTQPFWWEPKRHRTSTKRKQTKFHQTVSQKQNKRQSRDDVTDLHWRLSRWPPARSPYPWPQWAASAAVCRPSSVARGNGRGRNTRRHCNLMSHHYHHHHVL